MTTTYAVCLFICNKVQPYILYTADSEEKAQEYLKNIGATELAGSYELNKKKTEEIVKGYHLRDDCLHISTLMIFSYKNGNIAELYSQMEERNI
jgi:hypothetical protein